MKKFILAIAVLSFASCSKDIPVLPDSNLKIRVEEDNYDVPVDNLIGSWSQAEHQAQLLARGDNLEQFRISLPELVDTGNYPSMSIANISYTDNKDFVSDSVVNGVIHIAHMDSIGINGDFRVRMSDSHHSFISKTLTGTFTINAH